MMFVIYKVWSDAARRGIGLEAALWQTRAMPAATNTADPTRPTLYGVRGWGSTLVEAMLAVAEVPFTFVDIDGFDAPGGSRDLLLSLNPLGQVPTLLLPDGTIMTESAAIALHLGDQAPESWLVPPADAPERALFLRYLVWLVANVYPTFTYGDYPARWSPGDSDKLLETTNAYRKRLWQWFDGEAKGPYVLGERMSVLDIYIAIMIHWRPTRAWFATNAPKLTAIADRTAEHPVIADVIARNFRG